MSPIHMPTVGTFDWAINCSIRTLSWGLLAIVANLTISACLAANCACTAEQIVGRLVEVVQTDNAFRLTVARHGLGHIVLQINILDSMHNRGTQQHQAIGFGPLPFAAVGLPPTTDDHGSGSVVEQTLEIDLAGNIVQSQFHQLRSLFHQMSVFGDHMLVTPAANTHTDHRSRSLC